MQKCGIKSSHEKANVSLKEAVHVLFCLITLMRDARLLFFQSNKLLIEKKFTQATKNNVVAFR